MELLREKNGKASFLAQWQTWVIIVLVAAVGVMWYYNWGPFAKKGETSVNLGYTLSDGTEVQISGQAMTLYADPQTLKWYADINKTQRVTGLWGMLRVTASTNLDTGTINVSWDRIVKNLNTNTTIAGSEGEGTIAIPPETTNPITASKYTYVLPTLTDLGPYYFKWVYNVAASATDSTGTKTATATAEGTINAYYVEDGVLSIYADITSGYLQLIR